LRESVESALAAAEELMKKRIQETDQSRLAEEYLASVVPALTGAKGGRA
jgi:hypothetical protein